MAAKAENGAGGAAIALFGRRTNDRGRAKQRLSAVGTPMVRDGIPSLAPEGPVTLPTGWMSALAAMRSYETGRCAAPRNWAPGYRATA
ncbi:MAG TPA: hypothetical protein P5205_10845 [Candidatus Paceibacterota bacterium]|nr:hypothetical protein [Verrucomicrobiota bacterium]HSA10853.1 hypothetical protein [Candidatus Paceibacterota bacterium]